MRLFRQKQFGDWDEVLERITAELRTSTPLSPVLGERG
jgi:hypothetical protein